MGALRRPAPAEAERTSTTDSESSPPDWSITTTSSSSSSSLSSEYAPRFFALGLPPLALAAPAALVSPRPPRKAGAVAFFLAPALLLAAA